MENTGWERAQSLFHEAAALPRPAQQNFVDLACGNDREVYAEVLAMLKADAGTGSILDEGLSPIARRTVGLQSELGAVLEIGPYKLLHILGEGGMGVVWLAEREDTGQRVAVKLLLGAGFSPARHERFTREIKLLAKLKHVYIARLHDAGSLPDGTPWFAMEYVEGERLTDWVSARAVPVDDVLKLFRKICEAVHYAHSQEIIHRDLKPSNILVEADGTPRLLDFGIARELQGLEESWEQTRPGLRFLSPHYAAPEWVRDGTVGFFTDVYSLGVLLYELLTGKLPLLKTVVDTVPEHHAPGRTPEKPSANARPTFSLSNSAWIDLDVLCLTALRSDAKQRYVSVEALLRDLSHYERNEALEAQPDAFGYRLEKFIKRNRQPVLAASLTLALVVALTAFFTVRVRLAKARDAALAQGIRKQHIEDVMLLLFGNAEKSAAVPSELRAVNLLGRGVEIANALNTDPETQADLYKTLGRMYNMLGDSPKADQLLQLALEKERLLPGANDIVIADLLTMRGIVLADEGRFKEGEQSATDANILASRVLRSNDPEMMYIKSGLGRIIGEEGHYRAAVDYLTPLIDWKPETDEQAETLSQSLAALGVAQFSLGDYAEAEVTNRRALKLDRRIFGENHPRTGGDLWNLALNESSQFRYAEAETYYRQAIGIMEGWNGRDNPETAAAKSALARTLIAEGRDNEAYPILHDALPILDLAYAGKDIQIAATLDGLGRIEESRGHLRTAEADFARAAGMDQSLFGDRNYQTAIMNADLGDVYIKDLQPDRGEALLRASLAVLKLSLHPSDGRLVRAEELWGHALVVLQHYGEAKEPLVAAYQALTARNTPPLGELSSVRRDLQTTYMALRNPVEASLFQSDFTKLEVAASGTSKVK